MAGNPNDIQIQHLPLKIQEGHHYGFRSKGRISEFCVNLDFSFHVLSIICVKRPISR
jgi:hypothetical protein